MEKLEIEDERFTKREIEASSEKNLTIFVWNNQIETKQDLIEEGVYEGGYQLWEGTVCLLKHLLCSEYHFNFNNTFIIDVGCGQGHVGAFALSKGANVLFQDFNEDVIEQVTKQVIEKNITSWMGDQLDLDSIASKANFLSGDWGELATQLTGEERNSAHYIFMADTIYNVRNYSKLYQYIRANLSSSGICVCSCQAYYYGCGGGEQEFKEFIQKYREFDIFIKEEFSDGKSIDRFILYISWKPECFSTRNEVPEPMEEDRDEDFLEF